MVSFMHSTIISSLLFFTLAMGFVRSVSGTYNISRNDNLAVYWGQDSSGSQASLSTYCEDDVIDNVILAFLYIFEGKGGQPVIDFADACSNSGDPVFTGTDLADCSALASQIETCQKNGKIVTLSLGGATGKVGFSSDAEATTFADTIWDDFLGGNGDVRPLGDAVLDGHVDRSSSFWHHRSFSYGPNMIADGWSIWCRVDLDIESGTAAHYAAFVNEIRAKAKGDSKQYYITAAPQCPYPDAYIGDALNEASFDAVYVQFYNNYCGLDQPSEYNFDTWDTWAKTKSFNKDVKVYIGAPASSDAAGTGYVDNTTLAKYATDAQNKYSSMGGVMLWDASEAYANHRFDKAIKNAIVANAPPIPSSSASPSTTRKPASSSLRPSSTETSSHPADATPTIPKLKSRVGSPPRLSGGS
ncbi:glycoside hydrolase [Stereum hirsutum FP-91666 SS1]|uniref:glycoside hydrolase n=1 Tax=Stereum hirsutum (strain FP-91666) TaxID=721885 RepID=UPI000440AEED|nr:glycoside hydrolase [Stereum hirsutum FP-91666 SS1]EIM91612.1 glycoside hydrolase [Stereum hirsutum FP-91666 SS1]